MEMENDLKQLIIREAKGLMGFDSTAQISISSLMILVTTNDDCDQNNPKTLKWAQKLAEIWYKSSQKMWE